MLFKAPDLNEAERSVVERIDEVRDALRYQLTPQRQWVGLLRRAMFARAIRGSNSIEGYNVSLDDAVAAVAGEEPTEAAAVAWLAVSGYRDAMTYVVGLADDPHFRYDEALIRGLHYMMLKHELEKSPGRWRPGPVFVLDERTGAIVYTGSEPMSVPALMREFVIDLQQGDRTTPAMVRGAMAHLNLVMIHPFRDGNGRVSRLLLLLQCYHLGYEVGRYISLERLIEENKDRYYETLEESSYRWHEGKHNPWPYLNYLLFILKNAYREFEERAGQIQSPRGAKTELVMNSMERTTGPFSISDIQKECPTVSIDMIRRILKSLRAAGRIKSLGRGQKAQWQKTALFK